MMAVQTSSRCCDDQCDASCWCGGLLRISDQTLRQVWDKVACLSFAFNCTNSVHTINLITVVPIICAGLHSSSIPVYGNPVWSATGTRRRQLRKPCSPTDIKIASIPCTVLTSWFLHILTSTMQITPIPKIEGVRHPGTHCIQPNWTFIRFERAYAQISEWVFLCL
jgi:hypothetical protein